MPERESTFAAAAMMLAGWAKCATDAQPPTISSASAAKAAGLRAFRPMPRNSESPTNASVAPPHPARRPKTTKGHWISIYTSSFQVAVLADRM